MERQMRQAFWQQAESWANSLPRVAAPRARVSNAGAECELFLYHSDGTLATDQEKWQVINGTAYGYEAGAAAVEIHPGPVNLESVGFGGWYSQLAGIETALVARARNHGLCVGRCGTVPWDAGVPTRLTELERYQIVPPFHNKHRSPLWGSRIGRATIPGAEVMGLCNAFQFTLEAESSIDAIDKLNRLLMISPMAVALGANAPLLKGKETGFKDVRFEVWRRSHDVRGLWERAIRRPYRVGLPVDYYYDLNSVLADVARYPFILNDPQNALKVGFGLMWRDARLKPLAPGRVGVEFRPLSTQPSLFQDIALAVFVVGRLLYSQFMNESLLDMDLVWKSKNQAEKRGLKGWPGLKKELVHAQAGLEAANLFGSFERDCLAFLQNRVNSGKTPGDELPRSKAGQLGCVKVTNW